MSEGTKRGLPSDISGAPISAAEAGEWCVLFANGVRSYGFKTEAEAVHWASMSNGAQAQWRTAWKDVDAR